MSIKFFPDIIHSNKKNEDFYVIRVGLFDGETLVKKSEPILWLTKEMYDKFLTSK